MKQSRLRKAVEWMNKPCEHCDKVDCKKYKSDYFKCEKPCEREKMCKRNDEQLLKMLRGGAADGN